MMKKTLLLVAALCGLSVAAQAAELFVNISSDETMAQGAGLVLAGQAQAQKVPVRVLLCDDAADMALQGEPQDAPLKPKNVNPQQMLQGLIKGGAKVEVCALYLPNKGRQAKDLIEGVTPANPSDVMSHVLKAGVKTLSF